MYYRIGPDPERFIGAEHHRAVASSGATLDSSPSVVWRPWGGSNGTIVLSGMSRSSVFVNQVLGAGEWIEVPTPEPVSYTRTLRILKEDPRMLLLNGGGVLGGTANKVTVSLMNLEEALAAL